MDIIINQQFVINNPGLAMSEILVYSLMKTFKNSMSMNDLICHMEIINDALVKRAVKSLIAKDLIVSERNSDLRFSGILFYKVKK